MPPSKKARNQKMVVDLLDDTIALVRKALVGNLSDAERRSLEQLLLRLESERGVHQAELDAELAKETGVQGPKPAQVAEVGALSNKVVQAAQETILAGNVIALGSEVFALATSIITPA